MSDEFVNLIKELQTKLSLMNIVNDSNWTINYSKSLILFEAQSCGNLTRINNIQDVNKLLDGFVEKYCGNLPEIILDGLKIKIDRKGKYVIYLKTKSEIISNMRMNLAYYFNYISESNMDGMDTGMDNEIDINNNIDIDNEKNIIIKKFINLDGKEIIYNESIDIELPIIHESHLKKNINIFRVYLMLSEIVYNYYNKPYYTISLHFETENKRAKKISLW
jgi:hypothetical protein